MTAKTTQQPDYGTTGLPSDPGVSPRAWLYYPAVIIQLLASAISGVGYVLENNTYFLGGTVLWLFWFVIMFMLVRPQTDNYLHPHVRSLKRSSRIIFIVLVLVGIGELIGITVLYPRLVEEGTLKGEFAEVLSGLNEVFEYNDSTILIQQAAQNLLDGKNPYESANIVEGLIEYEGAPDRVTPLRAGRFEDVFPYPSLAELETLYDEAIRDPANPPPELESKVCYPAGSFVLPAPFIALGIRDIRWVFAIFALIGMAYAVWRIPAKRRLVFIGGVLISLEFWNSIGAGETNMFCFPLIMIAWLSLDRNRWLSLLFMGLAIATKQTAWFITPFYLVLFIRLWGWSRMPSALGVITGVFFAFNIPFIIADPNLWLRSVASPMIDPMFPLGVGIVTLVTSGLVDIRFALPFTIMEVIAGIIALVWYWRNCREYPHTALILAVIPLFFAWRSLWTYFFYVGIVAFAGVLSEANTRKLEPAGAATGRKKGLY